MENLEESSPLSGPVWTPRRAVKRGKSGGSVGAACQGKGKGSREGKKGQEAEEGHRGVRGRWAPPPMEGKGPREGQ